MNTSALGYIKNVLRGVGRFDIEVLRKYQGSPKFRLEYASESYGCLQSENFRIPFGVIKDTTLVLWGCDFNELPEAEKIHFRQYTASLYSHGWLEELQDTEFYRSQVEVEFTDPIIEETILEYIEKINDLWEKNFGYIPLKGTSIHKGETSKYKNILLPSFDIFRSYITDWWIHIIEAIPLEKIKTHADELSIVIIDADGEELRSRAIFEKVLRKTLNITISSFKDLTNLRNYVDHKENERKKKIFSQYCTKYSVGESDYVNIYKVMIKNLSYDLERLVKGLETVD